MRGTAAPPPAAPPGCPAGWAAAEPGPAASVSPSPAAAASASSPVAPSASRAAAAPPCVLPAALPCQSLRVGVLLKAHDTKAARNEARVGGDPGARVVAGATAWHDAVRSVLYMHKRTGGIRILECTKANDALTGWGAMLTERQVAGTHRVPLRWSSVLALRSKASGAIPDKRDDRIHWRANPRQGTPDSRSP